MRLEVRVADAGSAKRVMTRKLEREARLKMEDIGREMVVVANKKMRSLFDLNRPAGRRRYPGSVRAANALDYQIDGSAFPIFLRYRVRGGDDVVARIVFMNWGTAGHTITPSGNWSGRGQTPPPMRDFTRTSPGKLAWFDGAWVVTAQVSHPGQGATNFLHEAAEEALAKFSR